MKTWIDDLRYAWRRVCHSPGFSLAAVLMLGLGIGASVAMYSVLQGVILSGMPYPGGDRVVAVSAINPRQGNVEAGLTQAEAQGFAEAKDGPFEAFGYYDWNSLTVLDADKPRELSIARVSAGFFHALGVAPLHGRWFEPADMQGQDGGVILSFTEWQRLTGGDPASIGSFIDTVDSGRLRLVGVMPPEFSYPDGVIGAWRPYPVAEMQSDNPVYWNARFMSSVGRYDYSLSPQVARERSQARLDAVRESFGTPDVGWQVRATPLLEEAIGDAGTVLWASFGVALLVLAIACANVAILIDARQIARAREQAIAQALGAGRRRLFRVMLFELGLLALGGAALGVAVAALSLHLLAGLAAESVPRAGEIRMDRGVLAFALLLGVMTPMLSVVLGALRVRGEPGDAMRSGGKGAGDMVAGRTRLLPVLGVALSTLGLFAAAALVASLVRVQDVDPGYRTDNTQVLQLFRDGGPAQWASFAAELETRLRALPGVTQVAIASSAPLSGIGSFKIDVAVPGREDPEPLQAGLRRVSPGYLDTLAIPLLEGRNFEAGDRAGSERVAIVNRRFAEQVFGSESALDKTVSLPLGRGERINYRIVGVSEDIRDNGLRQTPRAEVLVSFAQEPWVGLSLLVHTATPLPGMAAQMREAMWQIDPREAATREYYMPDEFELELKPARFFAHAVGGFSLCALLLAALGVYAVASQHQQQRRAEYGLRLAIGAPPARLARQSLAGSLRGGLAGVVLGALAGWAALRFLQAQLFEFGVGYAPWFGLAIVGVTAAVLAAALPPALRAGRTEPMTALRHD
ncbi:MAG: ABC transporter permease [Chiayiivirga sp.]|jgi:putative ABC transport system permease protein|uniref:ABC transporter permease n=1 Tax=Chiayiivirga sp. TaxID=2041042 RepID=UPI0025C08833|nr:ABC transporter permease [Chiayiivirga sp.]MCI1709595.1 ABC transporter permease [Chiayiivirga sp.]MCI1730118.1 ABC transporter permease [Chiayiivirga sp.]